MIIVPFNRMWTVKVKAQVTNAFFVNQILGNSSRLPTSGECMVEIIFEYGTDSETVDGSSWRLGGAAEHLIDGDKKCVCRLNFRVCNCY